MPFRQPERVVAIAWLVIEPVYKDWGEDPKGRKILDGAKVVSLTQGQPTGRPRKHGSIVTKITLDLNAEALLPLQPEVVINIEPGDVGIIEVHAEGPQDEEIEP